MITVRIISPFVFLTTFLLPLFACQSCPGQFEFEKPPINYSNSDSTDRVARLAQKIKDGQDSLTWDEQHSWLPSILEKLDIDPDSQLLVFSKTSLQTRAITPRNPRAVYFNDEVYVGFVPGGDIIELSAVDKKLGAVFYSIDMGRKQSKDESNAKEKFERTNFIRDETQCMTCHGTSKTNHVPGFLVRSVYPSASGHPHYSMGTITTSLKTEFLDRFGGWYVTGSHGTMRHRGNSIARKDQRDPMDYDAGANLNRLPSKVDIKKHLRATSDLVALMVLEHQSEVHNAITFATYETLSVLEYQKSMNEALERDSEYMSDSSIRRLNRAADSLVESLLCSGEFQLTSKISGNSNFAATFEKRGPNDSQNRSLRQLDLSKRLFRFPCSYLIYTEAFDAIPQPTKAKIFERLIDVLSGTDQSKPFKHLSDDDRRAILEILLETKPSFKKAYESASK